MKRTIHLRTRPDGLDLSAFEVVTPHKGAARALGVPHRSLQGMALSVLKLKGYDVASPMTVRRTLTSTVGDVLETRDATAMSSRITLPLQTILRTGIDTKLLEEVGSRRVRELARVTAEYQFRLRRQGLVDPSEILWQAALLEPRRRSVLIYGYYRTRLEELTFLNAMAGDGSVFLLPYLNDPMFTANLEGLEILERQGWAVDRCIPEPQLLGDQLCQKFLGMEAVTAGDQLPTHAYSDLEAELRGVLTKVKQLLADGTHPDEIVLVARDAKLYGPTLLAVGWEYGLPVRATYAVPLTETKFGSWLGHMLNAIVEQFPFETTLRMLVHPIGPDVSLECWREARRRRARGLSSWTQCGVDLTPLRWLEQDTRGGWIRQLQSTLHALKVRQKSGRWAREVLAFHQLFDELQLANEDLNETVSREKFVDEVREVMSLATVPFHPGIGGIELHEPHTLLGSYYKHVFVMGMAEGITPGPVAENPIVDFHERKKLAQHGIEFEGAAAVTRWEALSFYFLLQTVTEACVFSYPRSIDNQERLPSAYFSKLGLTPKAVHSQPRTASSPEEVRRLVLRRQDFESEDQVLNQARQSWHVELTRERPGPCDEYDGVIGLPLDPTRLRWSASQLTKLGQCPFHWFAEKVLKLAPPEELESGLSPATRGRLYHKALELALDFAKDEVEPRRVALGRLEEAFLLAEKDEDVGLPTLSAWEAQRLEHLELLRRAIKSPDFLKPGSKVLALEKTFEGDWHGLKVSGVVDRIDETPDGLVLIDYKTGASVPPGIKDEQGKARQDIQLPLYVQVAAPELYSGKKVAGAYYYSISKAKTLKEIEPEEAASLLPFAEKIKAHLTRGHYPVEPDGDRVACTYCDQDLVCRQGYRLSRKQSL